MKNHFAVLFPHFDFFMSVVNEDLTLGSIEDIQGLGLGLGLGLGSTIEDVRATSSLRNPQPYY